MSLYMYEGKNNARVMEQIENLTDSLLQGIRRANYLIGKDVVKEVNRKILAKNKTGRVYIIRRRNGARVRHQASAPGEAPANLSGALRATVDFEVKGQQLTIGAGGRVPTGRHKGKEVDYARELEKGTSKMAKRPYLLNTIIARQREAKDYYYEETKRILIGAKIT